MYSDVPISVTTHSRTQTVIVSLIDKDGNSYDIVREVPRLATSEEIAQEFRVIADEIDYREDYPNMDQVEFHHGV